MTNIVTKLYALYMLGQRSENTLANLGLVTEYLVSYFLLRTTIAGKGIIRVRITIPWTWLGCMRRKTMDG